MNDQQEPRYRAGDHDPSKKTELSAWRNGRLRWLWDWLIQVVIVSPLNLVEASIAAVAAKIRGRRRGG